MSRPDPIVGDADDGHPYASWVADVLDEAFDELYAVDPSDFVSTRKSVAARLRDAGDRDAAKEIQSARRPTKAAWILNQLARRHPDIVETLLDRGRDLRAAQQRAVTGRPDELRAATSAQREALGAARDAAERIAGAGATEAVRTQIGDTLLAASADDDVGEQLRRGRLVHESSGGTGFPDDIGGLRLVPSRAPAKPAGSPARKSPARAAHTAGLPKDDDRARAAQQREAERARAAELVALRAEQREARDDLSAAEDALRRAEVRVDRLRGELETAKDDARRARRVVTEAQRRQREIEQAVTRFPAARRRT
jgi:hypothetical protein